MVQHCAAQSDPSQAEKGNPVRVPLSRSTSHETQLPSVLLQKVISVV